jgi:DNA-binding NtrC family response regulator/tetratricopeptide (TPR) repeat protein
MKRGGYGTSDIERIFRESGDPERALALCRQAEKQKRPREEDADFNYLYAEILRWCNRPHSALARNEDAARTTRDPEKKILCLLLKGQIHSDLRKAFTAIDIFNLALARADRKGDAALQAEIRLALGEASSNAGAQNFALDHLGEALRLSEEQGLKRLIPNIYAHRALCEFRSGNLEASRIEAEKGILHAEADLIGAAECYRGVAIIHSVSGRSALAIENYRKSLTIFRKMRHAPGLIREYLSLGGSYLHLGETEMAEHFIRKALALAEEGENLPLAGVVYSRLGSMYTAQGYYDRALTCFEKDRELSSTIENPSNIAHIYRNLGQCLSLTGDYVKSLEALESAREHFAGVGDRMNEFHCRVDIFLAKVFSMSSSAKAGAELKAMLAGLSDLDPGIMSEHPYKKGRKLFAEACLAAFTGAWDEAEEKMIRSMTVLEHHLMHSEQAELMFLFGRRCVVLNHRESGVSWLRSALKLAETYSLGGMVKSIIDILDRFDEDILVDYTFEKEAAKVSDKDRMGEGGLTSVTENMIGSSEAFLQVLGEAREAADTEATILLVGATGTGKELLARAIHRWSRRAGRKFIAVNCGAIPKELVESVLFGHMKGAFTGAVSDQTGSIEAANGGTVFLDEVTELPFASQVKVLRFLEYKEIQPLGVAEARKVDVRVIASTNREPFQSVQEGVIREDLYYRLSVIPIYIPTLEQRGNDIVEISRHFIASLPLAKRKQVYAMSPAAESWLRKRTWPGNVRELHNVLLRAVVFTKGSKISVEDLEKSWRSPARANQMFEKLDDLIGRHILEALKRCNGNQIKAAEMLGIHRNTLRNKLSKLPLDVSPDD